MKFINLNYLVIIIYLISSSFSYSIDRPDIKNLIIHKSKKKIENLEFLNSEGQKTSIINYSRNPIIMNFSVNIFAITSKLKYLSNFELSQDFLKL